MKRKKTILKNKSKTKDVKKVIISKVLFVKK